MLLPEKVLLSERSVVDAAPMVMLEPALNVVPFIVPRLPVNRFVPIEDVAITFPFWSVDKMLLEIPENHVVPSVASVDDALAKFCKPVQELLFARSVDDAAVMVNEPPAVTEVPLIVASAPVKRLVPIDEVATTLPVASVPSKPLVMELKYVLPVFVRSDVEACVEEKSPTTVEEA